jgi:hypothetical protein
MRVCFLQRFARLLVYIALRFGGNACCPRELRTLLDLCMYVCMYVCVHICMHVMNVFSCVCMYVCHVFSCECVYVFFRVSVCMCVMSYSHVADVVCVCIMYTRARIRDKCHTLYACMFLIYMECVRMYAFNSVYILHTYIHACAGASVYSMKHLVCACAYACKYLSTHSYMTRKTSMQKACMYVCIHTERGHARHTHTYAPPTTGKSDQVAYKPYTYTHTCPHTYIHLYAHTYIHTEYLLFFKIV